jgi:translation initiation factor IF-3
LKNSNLSWRVDNQIRAPEVRVIGSDGKQMGIMKTPDALKKAKELGLSLIEIAPKANPPVAKIVEFGKFRYQEEKKARREQRGIKGGDIKEVRFSPFIAENDYNIRLARVKEFLGERNKVKLVVVFKKQQLGSKKFGYDLLGRLVAQLGDTAGVDMEPKFLGKYLVMVVSPVGKKVIKKEEGNAETKN